MSKRHFGGWPVFRMEATGLPPSTSRKAKGKLCVLPALEGRARVTEACFASCFGTEDSRVGILAYPVRIWAYCGTCFCYGLVKEPSASMVVNFFTSYEAGKYTYKAWRVVWLAGWMERATIE